MNHNPMECGPQPLEAIMQRLGLTSQELVGASKRGLTFKMVSKGCKGRRLTLNVQHKILAALKSARPEENLTLKDLFTYAEEKKK